MLPNLYNTEDTIAAIATSEGVSAIGVIRVSGKDAFSICNSIYKTKDLAQVKSHTIHYGFITDGEEIVDEVMLSVFKSPRSFTTEDSVEISAHGSPYILSRILQLLLQNGARLAQPGEFTMRAFMHGRLDLAQAEAVGDLIAAQNKSQAEVAIKQIRGGLSEDIKMLREQLLNFASLIELELDFGEEDVEFADRSQLNKLISQILHHIDPIVQSFKYGNAIKNGIPVAIIGRPNAGKSSLLNLLLNDDRAIVSDIAGTTRDTVEEVLNIEGLPFRFIDTAGIRATQDTIEKIGIEKALKKIEEAQVVIYIFDVSNTSYEEVKADLEMIIAKNNQIHLMVLANKTDLISEDAKINLLSTLNQVGYTNTLSIQANKASENELMGLKMALHSAIKSGIVNEGQTILTNLRHYIALNDAREALHVVVEGLNNRLTSDMLALDIKRALNALGEVTGEISSQEILINIFGKFCIGK